MPHSAKSKSGSNKLAHLVKKWAYRMRWMAYYLVRMVNGLFVCPIKATGKKHSGNEASRFFFLALLVKLTKATQLTPVRIDLSATTICTARIFNRRLQQLTD